MEAQYVWAKARSSCKGHLLILSRATVPIKPSQVMLGTSPCIDDWLSRGDAARSISDSPGLQNWLSVSDDGWTSFRGANALALHFRTNKEQVLLSPTMDAWKLRSPWTHESSCYPLLTATVIRKRWPRGPWPNGVRSSGLRFQHRRCSHPRFRSKLLRWKSGGVESARRRNRSWWCE